MNATVPVLLSFTDSAQRSHNVDLRFDLAASPTLNDPALLAARLAEEYGLTAGQQATLHDSICDQLHSYALYTLSCQNKAVGTSQIHSPGLVLPSPAVAAQVAAISASAYTGAAVAVPAQSILTALVSMAGVILPPPPPSGVALQPAAAAAATTVVAPPSYAALGTHGGYRPRWTGPGDSAYMVNKKRRLLQQQQQQPKAKGGDAGGGRGKSGSAAAKDAAAAASDDADDLGAVAVAGDDGNVDYCAKCDDAGDLVCCDRCPRSFHMECLKVSDLPDGEWRCPECERTFGAGGEHETEAGSATGPVVTAFFHGPFNAPAARCATVRDELWSILNALFDHEFAPSFQKPVNVAATEGYAALIKRPMDLGRIRSGVVGGSYGGAGAAFDPVRLVADLRLVFHNCRLFNKPLSTIWRMADVLFRELETALRDRVALTPEQARRLKELAASELPALPPLPLGAGAPAVGSSA